MRSLWLMAALFSSLLGACLMPKGGSPDAGPGGAEIKIDIDTGTVTQPGSPTGTGCAPDPTTGITLCTGTTECPGVMVDPAVFPECGFYGDAFDLECVCAGYLCPMGVATSCSSAAALLQTANEAAVCGEISSSVCTLITGPGTGGSSGAGGSGAADAGSGCDKACEAMCAGEPDCIQGCGC
jgi:hypothetical protein